METPSTLRGTPSEQMTDSLFKILLRELTAMGVQGLNTSNNEIDFVYQDYKFEITVKAQPKKL